MRLRVLTVDWSFEEVEGEYEEEGGGDPVEAHEQEHPLLVGSEKACLLAKGSKGAPVLLTLAHQWLLHFVVYYKSLTSYPLSCSISPIHYNFTNKHSHKPQSAAFERIYEYGAARRLGISNCYDLDFFKQLYAQAKVKPSIVQNRFYAKTDFDKNLRAFCLQQGVVYQSFWTLTANPHILEQPVIMLLCRRLRKTPAQIFFRYLVARGITPLTGTSDLEHMQEDLAISEFELAVDDLKAIDELLTS
jgi:diketogulonate reductase-like aldo/keto reductase